MKLSISWLKEYTAFNKSVQEVSESLTMIGNEVESIETSGVIPGVIVAEIQEISSHRLLEKDCLEKYLYLNSHFDVAVQLMLTFFYHH